MSLNPIEKIARTDVYYTPLIALKFDFQSSEVAVHLEQWDSLNGCFVPLVFTFTGVHLFSSDYPQDFAFDPDGCYDVSCLAGAEGRYVARWAFQISGQPVWEVQIGFADVTIEGGRSAEAQAHREEYFRNGMEG